MEFIESAHPSLSSIYVIGDSITGAKSKGAMCGFEWTAVFPTFFNSTQVGVVNAATGDHSARYYQTEGLWDRVTARLKPGDVVLIQFRRNDESSSYGEHDKSDTLPGIGPETQQIPTGDHGKDEVIHTYGWYIRKYLHDTRSRGANPVVLSWPNRDASSSSGLSHESPDYAEWARIVAEQEQRTSHVDLSSIIAREFEKSGQAESSDTSTRAAFLLAQSVVAGLKSLLDAPVSRYLSPLGLQVISATEQSFKPPTNPNLPTLWIVGDSTVRNGDGIGARSMWGWGDLLSPHFRLDKINVVNRAVSGRSSRTYYTMHWSFLLPYLRPGDLVLMQFGHNDSGAPDNKERARAALPGTGAESLPIANPITGLPEVVHTYGWYLRKMIEEARAAGAQPIVCTLVPQLIWSGDNIVRDIFAEWAATVAAEEGASWIDLNSLVAERYEQFGEARVAELFEEPPAHTNLEGALLTVEIVLKSLRSLNILNAALL